MLMVRSFGAKANSTMSTFALPGVLVTVGKGLGVLVGDGPAVLVAVAVGDGPAVLVAVAVGDGPAVLVAVGVGVLVAVAVHWSTYELY